MSAVIFGTKLNSGQKVLRESERTTEVDGLVSLTETYIIRSADIESIEPDRNTSHSSFSTATNKYTRMQVETTRVTPMDGGLATLVVNYVGLDYGGVILPPAYVTAVGQPGVGVFGVDASVVARYITQQTLFDLLKGSQIANRLTEYLYFSRLLPSKRFMPAEINGTTMPPNPRAREYRNRYFGVTITSEWLYAGYVQTSISFQRRGLFNQIEEQFSEYFYGSDDMYTENSTINLTAVNSLKGGSSYFF